MEALIALVALTAMEIVLGIDNIVVISIVTGNLPPEQRARARRFGLGVAMILRILLLLVIQQIMQLDQPFLLLTDYGLPIHWLPLSMESHQRDLVNGISWRDVIMLVGGIFLIAKTVHEIHAETDPQHQNNATGRATTFSSAITQILVMDVIFSLDSIITAVGMAQEIWVMILAVVLSVGVMMTFAGTVSEFVHRNPTIKMLALSFLILIGVMLVAEGLGTHVGKGYIYFAMAFSLLVEALNMRVRKVKGPNFEI
ncbi:MAG: TerC family protein [Planctomycetota bacterium]|nr:TerC family protein [Planctomycetota bacterium]MDA1179659.1 TerC family protein [Planctomycetota bacterium]